MGEIVEFPRRRKGCSQWRRTDATIALAARPACAALARALTGDDVDHSVRDPADALFADARSPEPTRSNFGGASAAKSGRTR